MEWDSGSMDSAAPSRFTQYLYFLGYWGLNPVRLACAFVPIWYTPDPCLSTLWEVSKYTQNFWEQTVVQAAACCLVLSGKECFLPVGSVLPAHGSPPLRSTVSPHREKHSEKVVAHCVSLSILHVLTCIIIQHLVGPYLSGDKSSEA